MPLYDTDKPELGSIVIRLPFVNNGLQFDHFLSYEYEEDYLTPSDASSFTVAGDELSDREQQALFPGARVDVTIDGQPQAVQYIRKVKYASSRHGGTVITFECRDWMSRAVDAHVDPNLRFSASQSLEELLTAVFAPFGMTVLATDNVANRNVITGRIYGTPVSKKGKPLKSYILHQIKPYLQEGAFAFASRVSQRFGLWCRPAVDGETVIVGKPDFDQEPRYAIHHKLDASSIYNNVLESDVEASDDEQPSIILASGFGGGGEFSKSTLRSGIINPLVAPDNSSIIAKYPTVHFTTPPISAIASAIATIPLPDPNAVPLYLYDPEAHDQDQLDAYLRRELSLRMRKSLTARYTIEGHKLNGQPIAVDTIISVDDDRSNLHIPMWVQRRRFSKRAGSQGTTTTMDLVRPGTLQF